MDRPTSSQLNPAPNGLSNIKGMPLAEPGATGQAFSRMVTESGQPVTNHDITDQSTSSDNQGYLNPEKEWLKGFAVQNQTGYKDFPAISVAIPLENYQVVEHDPENNTFSIYSITKDVQSTSQNSTDVDTKLNPPIQIPDQDGIGNSSKSTAPIAITTPRLKSEHLQQYTSSAIQAEEADENSSHIECQRELRKDPAYAQSKRELQRKRKRERKRELRKDPDYAERERVRQRERYQTDPAYAERERVRQRERYQTDPAYAERKRERQSELRKDPAYLKREREHKRELRKDPAYLKREREHKRELRKDPAYLERERERKRELRKDPAYLERERERKRELRKDPAYAKRERERKKQYRQSANSAKNSGDLPLTSNLTETTQSSIKNSEGTAPPLFSRQAEGIFAVPIDPSPVSGPLA